MGIWIPAHFKCDSCTAYEERGLDLDGTASVPGSSEHMHSLVVKLPDSWRWVGTPTGTVLRCPTCVAKHGG